MAFLVACNGHSTSNDEDRAPEAPPDPGVLHFGRDDVARPSRATAVTIEVTGLGAWGAGDSLQLVSPSTGTTLAALENDLPAYPSRGSTTITGQQLDWNKLGAPLIDAAQGDTTYVTQLVQHPGYASLGRAGIATGLTIRDGAPATLRAQLAPIAQDRKLDLRWQGRAFAALAAQAGPGATPAPMAAIAISALPEPLAHHNSFATTHFAGLPNLAVVGPQLASSDAELAIEYGSPFQAWTELVSVVYTMNVPVTTAQGASSLPARIVAAIPVDQLANGALAPPISPVQNARIGDHSLAVAQQGLGAGAVVAWDAPATGHATAYTVELRAVESSARGVELPVVIALHTQSQQVQLPALPPGKTYVLTITAISAAHGATLPYASADYVTAQLSL